ncbi:MAG: hypothetical protein ABW208_16505 [Pyrinomonadaceae bacterium]
MAESKPKPSPSLRTPGPKKKLGLVIPPALKLPHDELIKAEVVAEPTMPRHTSLTSQTSMPSAPSLTSQTRHSAEQEIPTPPAAEVPISPVRDYTKVPNSIRRDAVPAGLFKGKSKQLYDALYALTRGAVVPRRQVRISRPKLMKLAHIGSRVTFETNVNHLRLVGLLDVTVVTGEHDGNEYEVFIPEELEGSTTMPSQTSQTSETSLTRYAQKLDRLVRLETSQTRHTLSVENTGGYVEPKTSFKTNEEKTDDEAFALFVAQLRQAAREITGREPAATEAKRWGELAELLITELKIAAGRTTVSNVPAFLTEHLRRRLWKKEKRQLEEEGNSGSGALEAEARVDASKCPDCFGTGMWYPGGFEKGVARCGHEKLKGAESPAQQTGEEN